MDDCPWGRVGFVGSKLSFAYVKSWFMYISPVQYGENNAGFNGQHDTTVCMLCCCQSTSYYIAKHYPCVQWVAFVKLIAGESGARLGAGIGLWLKFMCVSVYHGSILGWPAMCRLRPCA